MFKTEDGLVNITVASDVSDIVFQPADWSIVNSPIDKNKAEVLSKNLYNMPTHRHIALVVNRHRRKDRIKGLSSLSAFDDKNWRFLDNININYGKPSTCSNNGFLPLSEPGFIFYKGDSPDTKATGWLNDDYENATNDWTLFPQPIENAYFKHTYYHKFSWDLQLLMMSLVGRRECSRFIYGLAHSSIKPIEVRSLYSFCIRYKLSVEIPVADAKQAEQVLDIINKVMPILTEEVKKS